MQVVRRWRVEQARFGAARRRRQQQDPALSHSSNSSKRRLLNRSVGCCGPDFFSGERGIQEKNYRSQFRSLLL